MVHVFIVNPIVCEKGYAQKLKARLSRIARLNYYVLTTKEEGHERELVELLCHFFEDESLRFYCCGGAGTLKNMINGISDFSKVEVAAVPFGTCDFLKSFDRSYDEFRDIDSLIRGEVVYVDYIKSNVGIALNSVSLGLDSEVGYFYENLNAMGLPRTISYSLATLYAGLLSPNKNFDIELDDLKLDAARMTEFFFGNGSVLGGNMHLGIDSDYQDGKGCYTIFEDKTGFNRIEIISATKDPQMEKTKQLALTGHSSKVKIRRENGTLFYVNLDGELANTHEFKAEVVRQGLRFVLPRKKEERKQ